MDLAANAVDVQFDLGQILLLLFVVVLLARLLAFVFERIKLPTVVGEIIAGVIIGNTLLYEVLHVEANFLFLELLAELGVIFLLFAVGLETRFSDLSRVGRTAMYVAIFFGGPPPSVWIGSSGSEISLKSSRRTLLIENPHGEYRVRKPAILSRPRPSV